MASKWDSIRRSPTCGPITVDVCPKCGKPQEYGAEPRCEEHDSAHYRLQKYVPVLSGREADELVERVVMDLRGVTKRTTRDILTVAGLIEDGDG